jgi:pro-kumamolisin-like protein/Big-like domain-containing protein
MNGNVSKRSGQGKRSRRCEQSGPQNPMADPCLRLALSGVVLALLALAALAPTARAQAPGLAGAPLAAAQNARVPSRITQPVDEANRITLRGNTHPLARPQFDQGAVADSQPIRRMLLLLQRSPDQETALRSLLDQQQSKSSASYRQWLTPQQFGQQFGPSDGDIAMVTSWLQSHGFQVAGVSAGRTVIEFSGNAGQVRSAFNTEIHRFVVNGVEHLANASDPQIPAALAGVVAGPVSLHNFPLRALSHSRGAFSRAAETGQVKPLLTVSGNNTTYFALGPADFAKIYNVPAGANGDPNGGAGQTIAIVGDSEICTKNSPDFGTCSSDDVLAFRNLFQLPVNGPSCPVPSLSGGPVCVILDGPDPGFNSDEIEGDLDTEWSGAIAPNAQIDFVIAEDTESTFGTDLAAEYIVNNNLAPLLSESFGECEAFLTLNQNAFENFLWEQAAAQGITVVVSAGDAGSAECDNSNAQPPNEAVNGNQVNGLASTPFNVAAGGTDFDINLPTAGTYANTYWNPQNLNTAEGESAKSYIPEIPWNDSCAQSLASPPSAAGCSPPGNIDELLTVGGGGGQSNCLNATLNNAGLVVSCGSAAALTKSNLAGYPKPSWQSGSAVTGTASTDGLRDMPDISLFAAAGFKSNSFYTVCEADQGGSCQGPNFPFLGVGGTSSSAPAFAGIMALVVNQQGSRQGNPNYVLYALASKQTTTPPAGGCNSTSSPNTASCTFYDVTLGNNSVPCLTGSLNCVSGGGEYGVIESPSGTIAFNAGTGYDLATGLGTINVTNLISNWSSVAGNFMPTTTTLCLIAAPALGTSCATPPAAVTITHGQQVNGLVKVMNGANPIAASNSATKAEIVSLIGSGGNLPGGTAGVDVFTSNNYNPSNVNVEFLTSGSSLFMTNGLVGGTSYTVKAHYAGDGTFGASDSGAITVTVNPEPSQTTVGASLLNFLSSTINPNISGAQVFYGDAIPLRADVVGINSGLENGTGTVSFRDNGNLIGSFALNTEGYTEIQTGANVDQVANIAALAVGPHSVSATYNGDNSYCPSPGAGPCASGTSTVGVPVAFIVVAAPTSTSVSASTATIAPATTITVPSGTAVTLSAFVDTANGSAASSGGSFGAALAGNVTFTCTPAVTGCGNATPATSFVSNGNTADNNGFVAGVATLNNVTPSTTTTVTATFTPTGSNYSTSTSTLGTLTVSSSSFSLAPLPAAGTTLTIPSPGQSANTPITASSATFSGNVTLTCSVAPSTTGMPVTDPPTCSFTLNGTANSVITLNQGSNPPVTSGQRLLVVNTTAASAFGGPLRLPSSGPNNRRLLEIAAVLLALLLGSFRTGFPARRLSGVACLAALVILLVIGTVSCGGSGISNGGIGRGGSNAGTTVTSYTVTVTATPSSGSALQTSVQANVN